MATIYEVSKLAGVSLATVSRVMNKNSNVSTKTKQKVLTAMEQLGYRPNSVAQSLASSRSNCVGVLVAELQSPFYGSMMGGIESELRAAHKHIVVTASHCDEEQEKEDIEFLIGRNCDALILHVEAVSDEYLINLCKGKTPVVILNRYIPEIADNCISLNNELGGYLSTKAVLEAGHRDIVYIAGPNQKKDAKERFLGHARALQEFAIEASPDRVFFGDYLQSGGTKGIEHFLNKDIHFTALICANDEMATGAMLTARQHNIDIPTEISIMGFDNVLFSSYTHPTLSTIDYPISEMGGMAAKLVLKTVYNEKIGDISRVFEPKAVIRESVVAPKS